MLIGIIGAMSEEVEALKKAMKISDKLHKAKMDFYRGELWSKEVVVVVSGVGKVNAAICTQILVDFFDVDKIINVGVAGGVGKKVEPGDVVIGTSLIQHDIDTTMFGESSVRYRGWMFSISKAILYWWIKPEKFALILNARSMRELL